MRKKILLLTGSINQTTQMHQVANELSEYDCWFSQMFSDAPIARYLIKNTSLVDTTIVGNTIRKKAESYLRERHLNIDYEARLNASIW